MENEHNQKSKTEKDKELLRELIDNITEADQVFIKQEYDFIYKTKEELNYLLDDKNSKNFSSNASCWFSNRLCKYF